MTIKPNLTGPKPILWQIKSKQLFYRDNLNYVSHTKTIKLYFPCISELLNQQAKVKKEKKAGTKKQNVGPTYFGQPTKLRLQCKPINCNQYKMFNTV
jgi:hypothetical protein